MLAARTTIVHDAWQTASLSTLSCQLHTHSPEVYYSLQSFEGLHGVTSVCVHAYRGRRANEEGRKWTVKGLNGCTHYSQ